MVDHAKSHQRVMTLAGSLPKRSETFVWREVFALRDRGLDVRVASVHAPERDLAEPRLDALADEVLQLYPRGGRRLLLNALAEACGHPLHATKTVLRGAADACRAEPRSFFARMKIVAQTFAGLALARDVRRLGVTHIHAHFAHVPATLAMVAAGQSGVSWSFTGHANDLYANRCLLREKLQRCRFVACISHAHQAMYREVARVDNRRLPVIRCGVPLEDLPERFLTKDGPFRLAVIARAVPKKGLDVLLDAVAVLRQRDRSVQALLVGDGPEFEALKTQTQRLGIEEHVVFAGALSNRDALKRVATADVFVLPCRVAPDGDKDGVPVALMEAMAMGLPVIAGDAGAVGELVIDRQTGRLVTPGDVHAVVSAIDEMLDDAPGTMALAERGRAWVHEEFSMAVNAARMERALAGQAPAA